MGSFSEYFWILSAIGTSVQAAIFPWHSIFQWNKTRQFNMEHLVKTYIMFFMQVYDHVIANIKIT
jgi:hypothetical protein